MVSRKNCKKIELFLITRETSCGGMYQYSDVIC
jgi:hypothetical protein